MNAEVIALTPKDWELIRYLVKNGIATQYEMSHGENKVGAESTIWASRKRLKGFVEVKREEPFRKIKGKTKKYLGLTFKGLILAVKLKKVEPKNAEKVREINEIELPKTEVFGSLVEDMEKNFPEIFYNAFNLDSRMITDKSLPGITTGVALFTFFMLPGKNPEYFKKYIKEKGLILPDGSIFEDYEKVFKLFSVFIKPIFPKEFQQALEKGFRKVLGYEY